MNDRDKKERIRKAAKTMEKFHIGMTVRLSGSYSGTGGEITDIRKCKLDCDPVCSVCKGKIILKDDNKGYCPVFCSGDPTFTIIRYEDFIGEEEMIL